MTSPVDAPASSSSIARSFSSDDAVATNLPIAANPAWTDLDGIDADRLLAQRGGLLGREDHVRVVREDEHVVRRHSVDRLEDVRGGRVHRLTALDHAGRAQALEEPPIPTPRTHGDEPCLECRDRARPHALEKTLLALRSLVVHVRDLDALHHADGGAERECLARIVRVHVHLQRAGVADDEERVADLLELALERVLVELLALDDEHRAVAVLGELLVDRIESERLRLERHLGELLPGRAVDHAACDLDEPGSSCVDDSGVA